MLRDDYASCFRRYFAFTIDNAILSLIFGPILYFVWLKDYMEKYISIHGVGITEEFLNLRTNFLIGGFVLYCIYSILLEGSRMQGTIGKRLLGIRVATVDGEDLTIVTSAIRNLFKILSGLIFGLGFLIAVFSMKNMAFHDRISSTVVIRD